MTARDELAEVISAKLDSFFGVREFGPAAQDYKLATALLTAGYRKPRTITTAEELDALRFHAVILDAYGTPYVCERHRTDGTHNEWKPSGMNHLDDSDTVLYHGPATVLHEGEPRP